MDIKVKNDIVSPVKINKFGLYDLQEVSLFIKEYFNAIANTTNTWNCTHRLQKYTQ